MMKIRTTMLLLACLLAGAFDLTAQEMPASEIIRKADEKFNGEKSSRSVMSMTIVRPTWERAVEFKSWSLERDYALTLITAPASEKGQSFLKRGNEMWNWNPTIARLIKLPPSMMSQGWMGSDYTNDDILRESSIVNDYDHELEGEEIVNGRNCFRIRMEAKNDAAVIWGHQVRWIEKEHFLFMKAELYDEYGYLVRTELGSGIREMGGRLIPTRLELIPEEEDGHRTIVEIREIEFNIPISEDFFSQQNMKRIR